MPSFCAVANCSDKYGHAESISFHKFPFKRKDLLKQWQEFTQRGTEWMPSKWSAVCSRHFLESDFNCINERKTLKKTAVPTLRVTQESQTQPITTSSSTAVHVQNVVVAQLNTSLHSTWQQRQQTVSSNLTSNGAPANCRLCGTTSNEYISFANCLEIFAKIQKCFPMLSIQQNDALPQQICVNCTENINGYANFIDKVLEVQAQLRKVQNNTRLTATGMSSVTQNNVVAGITANVTSTASERQLKIKQEPFVRVKQEISEGFDSLFGDDLDIGIDDGCDHDTNGDEIEHKFQFCDFPMLNAQDIINNCDIMEIINLDDPFINITDDDVVAHNQPTDNSSVQMQATNANEKFKQFLTPMTPTTQRTINASELLQAELLNEEHNYANTNEESYEQWQLKHYYKKEKVDEATHSESDSHTKTKQLSAQPVVQDNEIVSTEETTSASQRVIVTNVSQILPKEQQSLTPAALTQSLNLPPVSNKPNIVVLNDSIVKSSDAFKLLTCNMCALKFFTNENLSQHYTMCHANPPAPMVCVPSAHIGMNLKVESNTQITSGPPSTLATDTVTVTSTNSNTQSHEYWYAGDRSTMGQQLNNANTKPQINILDMQQSFPRQPSVFHDSKSYPLELEQNVRQLESNTAVNVPSEQHLATVSENYAKLKRRFRQLQRKCHHLCGTKKYKQRCHRCRQRFESIRQLLQHKRQVQHYVLKPQTFHGKCAGCMLLFRTRLALRQHMRYICQSLPLRSFRNRLQNFKCRHCQAITYTHWRLYRRHEVKCRRRKKSIKPIVATKGKRSSVARKSVKDGKPLACLDCGKVFSSVNSLNQHRITHTTERRHKCGLCERLFKRRHGLAQHIRGFHLQLKPYACPVCKHAYALKCDMLRCRHSLMRAE